MSAIIATTKFNEASPIKCRATKVQMAERHAALQKIVSEIQPATVRQVFYQATVRGIIEKTEAGYGQVQRALAFLRNSGDLPWNWIVDNTRWQRKPRSFSDPQKALEITAHFYRKALWDESKDYVEVWIEKDALAGVVFPETSTYDVPLMVARGYSSLSFLYSSAKQISEIGRPAFIYHLGDYDPSGQDAARAIEDGLRKYAANAKIHFERLAVLPEQIKKWNLPTRPTKKSDSRAKKFDDVSVELDAINPDTLRAIVGEALARHLPPARLEVLRAAEESERKALLSLSRQYSRGAAS